MATGVVGGYVAVSWILGLPMAAGPRLGKCVPCVVSSSCGAAVCVKTTDHYTALWAAMQAGFMRGMQSVFESHRQPNS